jgi:hypothetical protein
LQRTLTKEDFWKSSLTEKDLLTKFLTVKDLWKKPDKKTLEIIYEKKMLLENISD